MTPRPHPLAPPVPTFAGRPRQGLYQRRATLLGRGIFVKWDRTLRRLSIGLDVGGGQPRLAGVNSQGPWEPKQEMQAFYSFLGKGYGLESPAELG